MALAVVGVAGTVSQHTTAHAQVPGQTYVSLQFDDGTSDQYQVMGWLAAQHMAATFFINAGIVGTPDRMTWAQLQALEAAGNEIGGHGLGHRDLTQGNADTAAYQVCMEREQMLAQGLHVKAFAYPFGSFNADTQQIVRACGYLSARAASGAGNSDVHAETLPPADPLGTRAAPSITAWEDLPYLERIVTGAERSGGGWVQIIFHRVCDRCAVLSTRPAVLRAFLRWLAARAAHGTWVGTTSWVMLSGSLPAALPATIAGRQIP